MWRLFVGHVGTQTLVVVVATPQVFCVLTVEVTTGLVTGVRTGGSVAPVELRSLEAVTTEAQAVVVRTTVEVGGFDVQIQFLRTEINIGRSFTFLNIPLAILAVGGFTLIFGRALGWDVVGIGGIV